MVATAFWKLATRRRVALQSARMEKLSTNHRRQLCTWGKMSFGQLMVAVGAFNQAGQSTDDAPGNLLARRLRRRKL